MRLTCGLKFDCNFLESSICTKGSQEVANDGIKGPNHRAHSTGKVNHGHVIRFCIQ